MSVATLTLNQDELALLVRLVESALGETKVELHHTHSSPDFREGVKSEVRLLEALLGRLRTTIASE